MSSIIDQMLERYNPITKEDKENAMKEIIQEILLCGLARANFFDKAVFYGGTALRIFYGLNRYSEDLDFSLRVKDNSFTLDKYIPILEKEVKSMGLNMKIETKVKTFDSNIKSAFLKGNTIEHMLLFYSDNELIKGINPDQVIKIKFEIDTNPPEFATFDTKYKLNPIPYECSLYDINSLFAGKIAAVLCRNWKTRTKGRDLYDYIFYLSKEVPFNLKHLEARLKQSNFIDENHNLTLEEVKEFLSNKFDTIDFEESKKDVKPFIKDIKVLDIWSAKFFKAITENLKSL